MTETVITKDTFNRVIEVKLDPVLKDMWIERIKSAESLAAGAMYRISTGTMCAGGILTDVMGAWGDNGQYLDIIHGTSFEIIMAVTYDYVGRNTRNQLHIVNDLARPCNRKRSVIKFIKENF